MYFQFEDYHPDIEPLGSPISRREGVLYSILLHVGFVLLILFGPRLPVVQEMLQDAAARRAERAEALAQEQLVREREAPRFVFVAPRIDTPAPAPPELGELSDQDRVAQAPERSPNPTNPLPFARGNTPERVESEPLDTLARGRGPEPEPPSGGDQGEGLSELAEAEGAGAGATAAPRPDAPAVASGESGARPGLGGIGSDAGGSLGEALRNLQQFVADQQTFGNESGGGGQFGPSIQFDTKGVEFGPWIRRFVAQIKRNWFIPYAAMSFKGHVVLTFNVHKDGSITDLQVAQPSSVEAFNHSAFNALATSNPTMPLPPEYPTDRAFFTVTFYYNESPPAQ